MPNPTPKPHPENLHPPWKPGETGNPGGYSNGRRVATKLRTALDVILENEVPETLLLELPPDMADLLPPGITFAELIALRVVILAARAPKLEQIIASAALILSAQARPDMMAPPDERTPPMLPTTEARRLAIAEQLGLVKRRKPTKKKAAKKRPRKKRAKK